MSTSQEECPEQRVSRETMAMAARVGERVDIYSIRLTAQESRLVLSEEPPTLIRAVHEGAGRRELDRGEIVVDATFSFEMARETEEAKKNPDVIIRATYQVAYTVNNVQSLTDEEVSAFGETNGVYNAWPFWRELVYSTMSRMGLPPITLPTFRIVEKEGPPATAEG